jgi:head-tail adaptor
VRAGKLDRRISILRYGAPVDDGYTLTEGALGVLTTRSASWRPATRKEQFENAGTEAKAGGIFWIRSDTTTRTIVETDKLVFEGRMFDILGLSEIGRREGIELLVAAGDDGTTIDISGLSPIPDALTTYTGWAAYTHTGAAQTLADGVKVALVNNAGAKIESQMPADVGTLYNGAVITGRVGDSIMVGIEFTFTPSDGVASSLSVNIDIGGAIGELYAEEFPITNGSGVPHRISYHPPAYTLNTWEANGGTVEVMADGPGVITLTRYVIHRLHKAR